MEKRLLILGFNDSLIKDIVFNMKLLAISV